MRPAIEEMDTVLRDEYNQGPTYYTSEQRSQWLQREGGDKIFRHSQNVLNTSACVNILQAKYNVSGKHLHVLL